MKQWKRYPKYKDSGVEWLGEIPDGWVFKRLKFSSYINPSKSELSKSNDELTVTFLPMELLGEDHNLTLTENRNISDVWSGFTYFENNDVILAKITPCFENGKCAVCHDLTNGIGFGTTELHVLRPILKNSSEFLFYVIQSHGFKEIGKELMFGTTGQKRLPAEYVSNYAQGFPPLPEQTAIASFLDRETTRIDALIEKKQRQIELLQEKRATLISQAVTKGLDPTVPMKDSGVPWLGEVPEHWDVKQLCYQYSVKLGKMLDAKQITGENLAPYLRNVDIQWDNINTNDLPLMDFDSEDCINYSLKPGDLMICEGGEIGRCAIWNGEVEGCFYQKALHRVRPFKGDNSRFLYYQMYAYAQFGVFESGADVSTIGHLTAVKLRKILFPFPPISEQLQIVTYLDKQKAKIEKVSDFIQKSILNLQEYRSALISAAVTGKIDVRETIPTHSEAQS